LIYRNINPRHAFAEFGKFNKARHHCHLYIDLKLRETFLNPRPATEPYLSNAEIESRVSPLFTPITMPTCHYLHGRQMCTADFRTWVRDFYAPEAATDYESQYESEADRDDRLGEYTLNFNSSQQPAGAYTPGRNFPGSDASGFGPNYPQSSPTRQ
jgi:hypothetical protein